MIAFILGNLPLLLLGALVAKVLRVALFPRAPGVPRASSDGTSLAWLPFGLGAAVDFNKDPNSLLSKQRKKLGDVFKVNFGAFEWVFVFGVKSQTLFFRAHNDMLNFNEGVGELIGDVGAPPDKDFEKMGNSLITKGFMKHDRQALFTKIASEVVDSVAERWTNSARLDVFKEISGTVLRVSIRSMLGDRAYGKHAEELIPLYQQFEADLVDPVSRILPTYIPLPSRRRIAMMSKHLKRVTNEEVNLRLEEMRQGKQMPNDYLQLLLTETGEKHLDSLGPHILMIVMAAHTNTAGTTAWTLCQLYSRPDLLARVRKEINEAMATANVTAARELGTSAQLPVLNACLRETGRLYSGSVFIRKAMSAFDLDGVQVPPGVLVATCPRVTSDDLHLNNEKYMPDRFIADTPTARSEAHLQPQQPASQVITHPQFGAGRHPCLGERFAVNVMQTVWLQVLTELDLEFVDPVTNKKVTVLNGDDFTTTHPPAHLSTLGTPWPKEKVWVRATYRNGRKPGLKVAA